MSLLSNTNAKNIFKQKTLLNKNLRKAALFLTTFCAQKLSIVIGDMLKKLAKKLGVFLE